MSSSKDKSCADRAAIAGAFASKLSERVINQEMATDVTRAGIEKLLETAKRYENNTSFSKRGFLFEAIEVLKFNQKAAEQGSTARARATNTVAGQATNQETDVEVVKNKSVHKRSKSQLKSYKLDGSEAMTHSQKVNRAINALVTDKYKGVKIQVHADDYEELYNAALKKAEKLKDSDPELAKKYLSMAKRLTKELSSDGVSSGGSTQSELENLTADPETMTLKIELKAFGKEVLATTASASAASAVIGGTISIVCNTIAYSKGNVKLTDAAKNAATDTGKAGLKGGVNGAAGAVVRNAGVKLAQKAGDDTILKTAGNFLSKSNVATAFACCVVDSGVTLWNFAEGKIAVDEAMERLGRSGTSMVSSILVGAGAAAACGAAPAVIIGLAGYLATDCLYNSCVTILKNARLDKIHAEHIERICAAAVVELDSKRRSFEQLVHNHLESKKSEFNYLFQQMEIARQSEDSVVMIDSLSNMTLFFGGERLFKGQQEFNEFMLSDQPLRF